MKNFMDDDFLLSNDTAKTLYHEAAKNMPLIDYHCHLSPKEIAENTSFNTITELMLKGDHYKWRQMLSYGIDEALIRGDGDDFEKFKAYATVIQNAIGNPLYHWTHLELQRVFNIYTPLNEHTAQEIYDKANALLQQKEFRAQGLIDKFNVEVLCTTDDPVDDLTFHRAISQQGKLKAKVLPTFRPDKAINITAEGFKEYIQLLEEAAQMKIHTVSDVIVALERRVDYFNACGALVSDHALDTVPFEKPNEDKANKALKCALKGEMPKRKHADTYKSMVLCALGAMYKKRGWAQQYHISALRNNNERMFNRYGRDIGFDSVNDVSYAQNLSLLLNEQDKTDSLPKTILYSIDPSKNTAIATMLGNFQASGIRGKMQMGSAWWFLDQKDGMEEMMRILANEGLLSQFVGMLTDSRSFISYPRHEYFRRILCNLVGTFVENGEYPNDLPFLKQMIENICYHNAKNYFGF